MHGARLKYLRNGFMLGLHDEQLVEQLGCPVGLINCSPKYCQTSQQSNFRSPATLSIRNCEKVEQEVG